MNRSVFCGDIALLVIDRHIAVRPLDHYAGIVTMQALVNLAQVKSGGELKTRALETLEPFYSGKVEKVSGAYDRMYRCGGNASALLVKYGFAPEILPSLVSRAEELIGSHPRHSSGVFGKPDAPEKIWIDTLFAVCPFLAILGNITGRRDFSDEALKQLFETHKLLFDPPVGLYHQSLNFAGPGRLSGDHWSRGNGWAALALAELVTEFPGNKDVADIYRNFMRACIEFQDEDGLWHQEMTVKDSYPETSGTGLILYAVGRGLELGILSGSYRENFIRGLRSFLAYIGLDGSVFNTCEGCLCPGKGAVEDYMAKPWRLNDVHSFGPPALAFCQALSLGINEIIF
jgi:unsaturated rhamnogalacturonyl hydrolase